MDPSITLASGVQANKREVLPFLLEFTVCLGKDTVKQHTNLINNFNKFNERKIWVLSEVKELVQVRLGCSQRLGPAGADRS